GCPAWEVVGLSVLRIQYHFAFADCRRSTARHTFVQRKFSAASTWPRMKAQSFCVLSRFFPDQYLNSADLRNRTDSRRLELSKCTSWALIEPNIFLATLADLPLLREKS